MVFNEDDYPEIKNDPVDNMDRIVACRHWIILIVTFAIIALLINWR